MQNGPTLTLWDGLSLSRASFASEPWKNCPPGILTVPSGHVGSGATEGAGGATGAEVTAANGAPDFSGFSVRPNRRNPPTPSAATAPSAAAMARPFPRAAGNPVCETVA